MKIVKCMQRFLRKKIVFDKSYPYVNMQAYISEISFEKETCNSIESGEMKVPVKEVASELMIKDKAMQRVRYNYACAGP